MTYVRISCPHCGINDVACDIGELVQSPKNRNMVATNTYCTDCKLPVGVILYWREPAVMFNSSEIFNRRPFNICEHNEFVVMKTIPEAKGPEFRTGWPETIRSEIEDVQDLLIRKTAPSIIVSTCRSILDVATKQLVDRHQCQPKKHLFDRIDELHSKGVIVAPLADWSHDIRKKGANATHDAVATPEDAQELVDFLLLFLRVCFSLPHEIEEKRASVDADNDGTGVAS